GAAGDRRGSARGAGGGRRRGRGAGPDGAARRHRRARAARGPRLDACHRRLRGPRRDDDPGLADVHRRPRADRGPHPPHRRAGAGVRGQRRRRRADDPRVLRDRRPDGRRDRDRRWHRRRRAEAARGDLRRGRGPAARADGARGPARTRGPAARLGAAEVPRPAGRGGCGRGRPARERAGGARPGDGRVRARQGLDARLAGLREAVDALSQVPAEMLGTTAPLERAREVLGNVGRRRELSGDHTVVALAGATGSGKSSLLNALAGVDAATVGARRPTTAHPLAVLWTGTEVDPAAARPLLEWLEVGRTHEVPAGTGGWVDPDAVAGLVLLDLPDIDSVQVEHRRRAERLARTVDALVWVLDPQKYADAVVHTEFLRPMARYAEVTVVVLNQVDTLAEA